MKQVKIFLIVSKVNYFHQKIEYLNQQPILKYFMHLSKKEHEVRYLKLNFPFKLGENFVNEIRTDEEMSQEYFGYRNLSFSGKNLPKANSKLVRGLYNISQQSRTHKQNLRTNTFWLQVSGVCEQRHILKIPTNTREALCLPRYGLRWSTL